MPVNFLKFLLPFCPRPGNSAGRGFFLLALGLLGAAPARAGEKPPDGTDAAIEAEVAGTLVRVIVAPWREATLSAERS